MGALGKKSFYHVRPGVNRCQKPRCEAAPARSSTTSSGTWAWKDLWLSHYFWKSHKFLIESTLRCYLQPCWKNQISSVGSVFLSQVNIHYRTGLSFAVSRGFNIFWRYSTFSYNLPFNLPTICIWFHGLLFTFLDDISLHRVHYSAWLKAASYIFTRLIS